ncbi:MAG: hypothetical protein ACLVEO_03345 [Lachnospiraceae bacterium]
MAEMITDKTMDEIEILAKLHLTEDEKKNQDKIFSRCSIMLIC